MIFLGATKCVEPGEKSNSKYRNNIVKEKYFTIWSENSNVCWVGRNDDFIKLGEYVVKELDELTCRGNAMG